MDFLTFLNSNNYQTYNRKLALKIGLEASIFLSELVDKYQFFKSKNLLIDEDWFYLSIDCVFERTALSRRNQETAIQELLKHKVIEVKVKGCPPVRHFRLNVSKLLEMLNLLLSPNQDGESDKSSCHIRQIAPYNKEPKEEPKEESNPLPLSKGEEVDDLTISFCKEFLERVKEKKPNFSKSITKKWHRASKALLKARSKEELEKIHKWALNDFFWSKNVTTPIKLWEHLDAIEIAQQNENKGPKKRFVNEENKSNAAPATKDSPRRANEYVF